MGRIPTNPSDAELLRAAEAWIDLLAAGDYAAAFAATDHDPYYRWTPELMRAVVAGYGLPEPHPCGTVFAVTSRKDATAGPPYVDVGRAEIRPPAVADIWHALPLNGEWSDLIASFRVEARDGHSVLILEEIHVF